MTDIFLKLINMSISASWLVLIVVILRLLLKKAPKWLNPVLWGIVGLRLVLPFSIESALSLIPSSETISPEIMYSQQPIINIGIPALNSVVNPIISQSFTPDHAASANPLQIWIPIIAIVWIVGIAAMLIYTFISYLHLSRRVKTAVLLTDNIYQSENVTSPFVLGILRPRIYLPFNMNENDRAHVVAHEQTHIKRGDHWIKPFGFLLLSLYWFNPLLWVSYILLARDIELACDEKVIKKLHANQRADYSDALLSCSVQRRMIAVCPLAFGEVGVKERVKNVLNYKKPAFWIIIVAVISCIVLAVCFLTNPKKDPISFSSIQITWANALDVRSNEITSYELNDAELGELKDRLQDLVVGNKNIDYAAFTPMYSLSIRAQGMEQFMIASYNRDGTDVGLQYEGKYYRIEDDEFSRYLSNICAGSNRAEAPVDKDRLSLNDVIMLSQKGQDLSWEDFESFYYIETGSGLYIHVYEINSLFSLWIGGIPNKEPMYIYLRTNTEPEDYIDIRTEDVTDFISKHIDDLPDESITAAYEISRLLYIITSSPIESSVPGDYITEHQTEYNTMVSYGEDTLRYCFAEFLKGNQTDLRGHIMAIACQDIMEGWGEVFIIESAVSTGQDWFNLFKSNAESMRTQAPHEDIKKLYPATWIFLQMQSVGTRVYEFNDSEDIMKTSGIVLNDNGTFSLTFSPISSYLGYGTYKIEDNRLILNTDDGNYTYVFDMVDDTLVFDADASSEQLWFSNITDGSVFRPR